MKKKKMYSDIYSKHCEITVLRSHVLPYPCNYITNDQLTMSKTTRFTVIYYGNSNSPVKCYKHFF